MAEYEEHYNQADYVAPLGVVRLALNWVGAVASVALVIGLVYWVFQLGTRNPNEIPIIRAMEGPSRTQPDNPGGKQANHQGLAVNAVQSEGVAEKTAETVVLAPKQQSLTQEDVTHQELAKVQPVLRPKLAEEPAIEEIVVAEVQPEITPTVQDPSLIIESIVVESESTIISSSEFAPMKSSIPRNRPTDLNNRIEAATAIAAQAADTTTGVASVPRGTRLVQLGAYDSEVIAGKEWDKMIAKHRDLMEGRTQLIQVAESGGRKFYRLRAMGFDTVEDSRNLCSALLARGTPCIPVSAR